MSVHDFDIPKSILKGSALRRAVEDKANEVAEHVKSQGVMVEGEPGDVELPVQVAVYDGKTRVRATVWLAHAAGAAVQAKNGTLTRAASAAGLKVKS